MKEEKKGKRRKPPQKYVPNIIVSLCSVCRPDTLLVTQTEIREHEKEARKGTPRCLEHDDALNKAPILQEDCIEKHFHFADMEYLHQVIDHMDEGEIRQVC
jgi:hypothetical protein